MFAELRQAHGVSKLIKRLAGYALLIFSVSLCVQNAHAEPAQPNGPSSGIQQTNQEQQSNFEALYRTKVWGVTQRKTREHGIQYSIEAWGDHKESNKNESGFYFSLHCYEAAPEPIVVGISTLGMIEPSTPGAGFTPKKVLAQPDDESPSPIQAYIKPATGALLVSMTRGYSLGRNDKQKVDRFINVLTSAKQKFSLEIDGVKTVYDMQDYPDAWTVLEGVLHTMRLLLAPGLIDIGDADLVCRRI